MGALVLSYIFVVCILMIELDVITDTIFGGLDREPVLEWRRVIWHCCWESLLCSSYITRSHSPILQLLRKYTHFAPTILWFFVEEEDSIRVMVYRPTEINHFKLIPGVAMKVQWVASGHSLIMLWDCSWPGGNGSEPRDGEITVEFHPAWKHLGQLG